MFLEVSVHCYQQNTATPTSSEAGAGPFHKPAHIAAGGQPAPSAFTASQKPHFCGPRCAHPFSWAQDTPQQTCSPCQQQPAPQGAAGECSPATAFCHRWKSPSHGKGMEPPKETLGSLYQNHRTHPEKQQVAGHRKISWERVVLQPYGRAPAVPQTEHLPTTPVSLQGSSVQLERRSGGK